MTITLARILSIAAFTLLPLAGVLFFGWDWREVLALYWLENVSLGVAMVVRMLRAAHAAGASAARGPAETRAGTGADEATITVGGREVQGPAADIAMTAFFAMHYGIFTLVHGVFVFVIIAGGFFPPSLEFPSTPISWGGILLVWVIGGAVQVLFAAAGPLPRERGGALMMSAYPRIIVLHLTILGSVFLIAALGLPAIAAVLLIGLHAVVDVAGWMIVRGRERRRAGIAGRASGPVGGDADRP